MPQVTFDRMKPRSQTHGSAHDKARKAAAKQHDPSDRCVRCGRPLGPMSSRLHYDHHDTDKTIYLGFSHAACNLSAAGKQGNQAQKTRRRADLGASRLRW